MAAPMSTIYVCGSRVKLTNRYDHTLYFKTIEDQTKYFNACKVNEFYDYTFLRDRWTIKVKAAHVSAREWTYLFFENPPIPFTNPIMKKRYYYFITDVKYISENCTELSLEMDVIQTYMFDWELRPCYVEREHSETDGIGENTIDEGLDVGEFLTAAKESINLSENMMVLVAASIDVPKFYYSGGQTENKIFAAKYGNIFGGFQITATPLEYWTELAVMLNYLNVKGKSGTVFTIWQYPSSLLTTNKGGYEDPITLYVSGGAIKSHTAADRPKDLDGYVPRNNKLFQYPFCFMYATNNNGGAAVYQYERFETDTRVFRIQGNVAPDAVVKLVPTLYKGVTHNYDESLSVGSFPVCSWNSDTYKLWLAQNQNQQNLGLAMDGLKIVAGAGAIIAGVAATGVSAGASTVAGVGSGVGLITSGVSGITSQLAQRADKAIQPPQARGSYSSSHNISNGIHGIDIYHKTIDKQHAAIIDDFFTMYGYACRRVKIPNISSRPWFNYVKTVGSNVTGAIPQSDLQAINRIFDHGITFWKEEYPTYKQFGNYSQDNAPE